MLFPASDYFSNRMDVTVYLVIGALFLALSAWCVFVWAAKSGQFRDVEDIKYKALNNELKAGADADEFRSGDDKGGGDERGREEALS